MYQKGPDDHEVIKEEEYERMVYFLNDEKGQKFLRRFIVLMPPGHKKKFFFTAFIVFRVVRFKKESPFAIDFFRCFADYLAAEKVKAKWVRAWLRELLKCGFLVIAENQCKLGILALVLTKACCVYNASNEEDQKLLKGVIDVVGEKIVADMREVLKLPYDQLFLRSVVKLVMKISPECGLQALFTASSL
jgi:hypothetical protein